MALAAATAALVTAPATASASASGCTDWAELPASCVSVHGASNHVQSVVGGVNLDTYQSAQGHFHVYGSDFDLSSADALYENHSLRSNIKYGPAFAVNEDLPGGSQVCASFVERRNGVYVEHPPACETIVP